MLRERRWSREFGTPGRRMIISRFMDGSATIDLAELTSAWPTWSASEQKDFALNCKWLEGRADFADMMRFLAGAGPRARVSTIAQSIASALPLEEAFAILDAQLLSAPPGERANLLQAVAHMEHPRALEVMRREVSRLLPCTSLWDHDPFVNWIAHDLTIAIGYVVHLGGDPAELESLARELAAHPCRGNVDAARRTLSAVYPALFPT